MKKSSFGGPKLVQVGSKTAQDGPGCGHARQILVSLQDSHYFLRCDTQRESTSSRQVAGGEPAGVTLSWAEVPRNALSLNRTIVQRDDDRISHALGTRPGEFSSLKQLLGITIRERTPGDRPSPIIEHRCPVADPQSPPTDTQSPVAGRPQLSEGGRRKRR